MYNNIPIIPIPDCRLSGDNKISSDNSIAYDPKLIIENNNYLNDIIDQINHLLSNGKAYSEVSKNWKSLFMKTIHLLKIKIYNRNHKI